MRLTPPAVGRAIDNLAGPDDFLWPRHMWPKMELNAPLGEGASGGHGFVRYSVVEYVPGKRVVFRFDESGVLSGIDGRHYFEVVPRRNNVILRHVVEGEYGFTDWLLWHLVIGPCHDALLEDGLDLAENTLTGSSKKSLWSPWVRIARWGIAKSVSRKKTAG
jgi:hypothetical protein